MLLGVALASLAGSPVSAQDGGSCACFDYQEVEALFLNAPRLGDGKGSLSCHAKDYSVELSGEVTVMDENFRTVRQVSIKWNDYDPARCRFLDASVEPKVDRQERWPHPAPEDLARACFKLISDVIAELDTDGMCAIYP